MSTFALLIWILAPPLVFTVGALMASWLSKRWRREILAGASLIAVALLAGAYVALVAAGGNQAELLIRNETPWIVQLSAVNLGDKTLEPGEEKEFASAGGPGWIDGLIFDIDVKYGPGASQRLLIDEVSGQRLTIVMTNDGATAEGKDNGDLAVR